MSDDVLHGLIICSPLIDKETQTHTGCTLKLERNLLYVPDSLLLHCKKVNSMWCYWADSGFKAWRRSDDWRTCQLVWDAAGVTVWSFYAAARRARHMAGNCCTNRDDQAERSVTVNRGRCAAGELLLTHHVLFIKSLGSKENWRLEHKHYPGSSSSNIFSFLDELVWLPDSRSHITNMLINVNIADCDELLT